MDILEVVILLLVAAVCGGIGQVLSGYSSGGLLASIALGFIGALLGMWIWMAVDNLRLTAQNAAMVVKDLI